MPTRRLERPQVNHSLNSSHAAHAAAASFEGPYGSSHHHHSGTGSVRLSSFGDVISEGELAGDGSGSSSSGGLLRGEAKEPSSYTRSLLVDIGRAIGE